jgi:hypothetical protein
MMRFFPDIFARKMPAPTPIAKTSELDELQTALAMRQAQVASLEKEVRDADAQLVEIGHLASNLKIRISEHDSNATAALDALEKEELTIRRVRDGLLLRIGTLRHELQPLEARAVELAHARDLERQDAFVRTLTEETGTALDELEGLWRNACSLSFDLMGLISMLTPNPSMTGAGAQVVAAPVTQNLDEAHRAQVTALRNVVNRRLLAMRLLRTNERWQERGVGSFNLPIVPAKPRADLAVIDKSAIA